jgi:hypothetical protein
MRPVVSSSRNACHVPSCASGSGASYKQVVVVFVVVFGPGTNLLLFDFDDTECPIKADDTENSVPNKNIA